MTRPTEPTTPTGELLLKTLAMPSDTNINGDIFGGWIMSQMDIAGGIYARDIARSRVVTVAVDAMTFIKKVQVGDTVSCYGEIVKIGTTSLTIGLEVWAQEACIQDQCIRSRVTKANFTYVAIDTQGNKQSIKNRD